MQPDRVSPQQLHSKKLIGICQRYTYTKGKEAQQGVAIARGTGANGTVQPPQRVGTQAVLDNVL